MQSHPLVAALIPAILAVSTLAVQPTTFATEPTVGVIEHDPEATAEGYVLFAPLRATTTYLIDNYGREVHSWESDSEPGSSVYLLENGDLLRASRVSDPVGTYGGYGGLIEQLDWNGDTVWEFEYSDDEVLQHHDMAPMPNGNVLFIAWEVKTEDEAIAAGRDPAIAADGVWPDHIVEVDPDTDEIVWEWHAWDHLIQDYDSEKENYGVVADHPELIDLNAGGTDGDWMHSNAIDYNEELDQILLSVRAFGEIWIIDHSTTTEEAAGSTGGNSGMGGDLLYRWGNPQVYGAGDASDQVLFGQHDSQWIKDGLDGAGNILIFNNGVDHSSIEEIEPPLNDDGLYDKKEGEAFGPDNTVWTYTAEVEGDFYARFVSGAQRLENGNTLACLGPSGVFVELDEDSDVVWSYVNPVVGDGDPTTQGDTAPTFGAEANWVFRATRIPSDYSGLNGRSLEPGAPLELLGDLGDFNNDGSIDDEDRLAFGDLYTGNCESVCSDPLFPTALGFVADFDEDNDVDCDDWLSFEEVWSDTDSDPFLEECEEAFFRRGDVDGDSVIVGIADAMYLLAFAFLQGDEPPCQDAADADGNDELVALADALYLLIYAYGDGPEPPLPGPNECGVDPATSVSLGCETAYCI